MSGPSPRTLALRFRIWQIAEPSGWNLTSAEIADRLGDVSSGTVAQCIRYAGWANRVRTSQRDTSAAAPDDAALFMVRSAQQLAHVLSGDAL